MPVKNILKKNPFSDTIVIPSSAISVEPTLELKTLTISRIARILGIFQAENVIVYRDEKNNRNYRIFCDVLKYLLLPPYLKKYTRKRDTLRKVGIAYPLNLAIHTVSPDLKKDPIRLGWIIETVDKYARIDVGIDKPLVVKMKKDHSFEDVVLVDTNKRSIIEKDNYYVGFNINCSNNSEELHRVIHGINPDAIIGTSVKGTPIEKCLKCKKAKKRAILFGGPNRGIKSLYRNLEYNEIINIMESQGTITIRTEEAICIALSKLTR
ncbi:MAG: hypothetical protein GSR79_09070 [Desulfurococcales archaeon]|nr:hypothetical protein [Desulfurococcales archaeon]